MSNVIAVADSLGAAVDQIPYAMSRALNDATFETRRILVDEVWPAHVNQRAPNFPGVVLHITRSTKNNLATSIDEVRDNTVQLKKHDEGGTKQANKRFAIPMPWYRAGKQTQQGLRKSAQAKALIQRTPKRALRITDKGIFIGEGGRLRLAFVFEQSVPVPKDVPFSDEFASNMQRILSDQFPVRLMEAMATRKPR